MKEFVEKLLERLEDEKQRLRKLKNDTITLSDSEVIAIEEGAYDFCKKIIAEEYSAITPQNSENSWIPCEKEFPNVGVTVLCYYKRCDRYNNIISYYYELMHRNEDYQWISNFGVCCGEVIKWMPLPPVYKEGSE